MTSGGGIVSTTTQTVGFYQVIIALPLAVTLKGFWVLMNMMQIIAYLRHFDHMPANLESALWSLYDAISFRIFMDWFQEIWYDFKVSERQE